MSDVKYSVARNEAGGLERVQTMEVLMPNISWDTHLKEKKSHCLSEIPISPDILYCYLLNLANSALGAVWTSFLASGKLSEDF